MGTLMRKLGLFEPDPTQGVICHRAPREGIKRILWTHFTTARHHISGALLWFEMRVLCDRWTKK
jgi:hypothetical protein